MKASGIRNVTELLDKGCTPQGRKEIANTTGISEKLVLRWVNMADLYRIHGIGKEYAELLEAAGVDTVPELAQRRPGQSPGKNDGRQRTEEDGPPPACSIPGGELGYTGEGAAT